MNQPTYEGAAFSQKSGNNYQCGDKKTYDKNYWETKKNKGDKEVHPDSYCPEVNKKDTKKNKSDDDMSRASQSRKPSKSDIVKLKRKMKKTFTTLEANIDELGDENYNLTSSDSNESSGNSHLQFHNKPTSFTGPKKFKIDTGYYVKIP